MVHARSDDVGFIDDDEGLEPLSDEEIEGLPAPETVAFFATIAQAWDESPAMLSTLGGNIFIHLFDVGSWTLITKGPNAGFHQGPTNDPIDFALICEEYVLDTMLYCDVSKQQIMKMLKDDREAGNLKWQGDPGLFKALIGLLMKPKHAGVLSLLAAR